MGRQLPQPLPERWAPGTTSRRSLRAGTWALTGSETWLTPASVTRSRNPNSCWYELAAAGRLCWVAACCPSLVFCGSAAGLSLPFPPAHRQQQIHSSEKHLNNVALVARALSESSQACVWWGPSQIPLCFPNRCPRRLRVSSRDVLVYCPFVEDVCVDFFFFLNISVIELIEWGGED